MFQKFDLLPTYEIRSNASIEIRSCAASPMISSIVGKLDLLPEYSKSSVPSAHENHVLEVEKAFALAVEFTKLQEKGSSTSGILLCALEMLAKNAFANFR